MHENRNQDVNELLARKMTQTKLPHMFSQRISGRIAAGGSRGAPYGERNGRYTDGLHTKEAIEERRWVKRVLTSDGGSEMSHAQQIEVLAPATASDRARPVRVAARVKQGRSANELEVYAPEGVSESVWETELQAALGTSSPAFAQACLRRLSTASRFPGEGAPSSVAMSAALAVIQSLKPENEIQAVLAVRIACLDAAGATLLARLSGGGTDPRIIGAANAIAKIERANQAAMASYFRLKHGSTQTIRVEKIEIQSGAQAVVGQIATTR